MVVQKHKKNCWQKLFAFLNAYQPKSQLINALNSFYFSRSYGRLWWNPKTGDFRELFLPETLLHSKFSKKTPRFWRPGNQPKTQSSDLNFFITCPSTYELNIKIVLGIWISSKCDKFWGQNQSITNQYS